MIFIDFVRIRVASFQLKLYISSPQKLLKQKKSLLANTKAIYATSIICQRGI